MNGVSKGLDAARKLRRVGDKHAGFVSPGKNSVVEIAGRGVRAEEQTAGFRSEDNETYKYSYPAALKPRLCSKFRVSLQFCSVGCSKTLYHELKPMAGVRPRPLSKARVTQKLAARIMMPAPTRLIQKLFILGTQFGVQGSPSALKSARACTLSAPDRGGLQPRREKKIYNCFRGDHGAENMNRKQL